MRGFLRKETFIRYFLFGVLVLFLLFVGSLIANKYREALVEEEENRVAREIELLGTSIEQTITRKMALISGLEQFVLERPDSQIEKDYSLFAEGLRMGTPGIRNLALAPEGVVTMVYPLKGNEPVLNYSIIGDPNAYVKQDVTRAIGTKQMIVGIPAELKQGGLGVIGRKAVFKNNKFWGIVNVVLDISSLVSPLEQKSNSGLEMALRDKEGNVFWGDASIFENNPRIQKISTVDGFWELAGVVSGGWGAGIGRQFNMFVAAEYFFGLLIFLLVMLVSIRWERKGRKQLEWSSKLEAIKPALWYFLFSGIWILFSDRLVGYLVSDPGLYVQISILKGWGFVVVTSFFLYIWTLSAFGRLNTSLTILKGVQSVARLGYYVLDIETGVWEGSDNLMRIFGINDKYKHDVAGWVDLVHPDQRKEMSEYFMNEVVGKGRSFDKEYMIVNKMTGESLWVHGLGSLDFDVTGKPIKMVGTIQDISLSKKKELLIREKEEKFRQLFDLAAQGIVFQDPDGKMLAMNTSGAKIFGVPRDQAVGKRVEEYGWKAFTEDGSEVKPEDYPSRVAARTGREVKMVVGFRLPHMGNELKWIELNSIPKFDDSGKKLAYIIATFVDITERKQSEERMTEINKRLESEKKKVEAILHNIGDAVFAVDEGGIVRLVSKALEEMSEYKEEELIGKPCHELMKIVDGKDEKQISCLSKSVLESGKMEMPNGPVVLHTATGKRIPVHVVGTPIKDESGKVVGVVVTLRNKTSQDGSDFVSLASHQLKTPLTGIKWFVELLHDNLSKISPEMADEYINKIGESNQRLIDLINDLLMVSKVEKGSLSEAKELTECSVKSLMKEARGLQDKLFVHKNIKVEGIDFISDDYFIRVDKTQMLQVFNNLLNNAAVYSPENSRVDVWVEKPSESFIRIMVKDEGFGVPEDQKAKIFDKFFRADNVSKTVAGSGLGLYVTKNIVEDHGGKIWFETESGKGSTFIVELPIKQKNG